MGLSKKQRVVAEAIKGKIQNMANMKSQDAKTDLLIKKTVNEISGLISSYELYGEADLIDRVHKALIKSKKYGMASSFLSKFKNPGKLRKAI